MHLGTKNHFFLKLKKKLRILEQNGSHDMKDDLKEGLGICQ